MAQEMLIDSAPTTAGKVNSASHRDNTISMVHLPIVVKSAHSSSTFLGTRKKMSLP